jgi:hypothetical protein
MLVTRNYKSEKDVFRMVSIKIMTNQYSLPENKYIKNLKNMA